MKRRNGNAATKSSSISEILRQEIMSGKFDSDGRLPSEHQLMRRFSVARETVRGALKSIGVDVPGDVMLAGVNGDDNAAKTAPPLTTMVQPCREIGEAAVEIMLLRLANRRMAPRETLLMTELVERESTSGLKHTSTKRKDTGK